MKGLIFTYLLTYGGAAAPLFNPFYGLLAYICFAIIRPESLWFWSVPPGNYSRIIAVAMLIGWAAQGFGEWRLGKAWLIALAFAAFWCWTLLSTFVAATNWDVSRAFLENIAKILLPFLVGMTTIRSVKQLTQLSWVVALSVGYLAYNSNETYVRWGIPVGDNMFAHTMAMGTGVAFFLGMQASKWWQKWTLFAASALMAHAVMFHMSRAAMLGLCVSGVLAFLVIRKSPRNILIFLLGVVVAWRLAGPSVVEEFESSFKPEGERDASAQSRIELSAAMWEETQQNPVLGLGPRHWPLVAHRHGFPEGKEGHNLWMQTAAETGIPGVLFLAVFYLAAVWPLWPIARGKHDPGIAWLRPFAQIVVVALPTFMVEQLFGSFSTLELPYYVALIGAAGLKLASDPAACHQFETERQLLPGRFAAWTTGSAALSSR